MSKLDKLYDYQTLELKREAFDKELRHTPARKKLKKLHVFLTEQQNHIARLQTEIAQKQASMEKLAEHAEKLGHEIELERSEYEQMLQDEECTAAEMTESRENHEKLLHTISAVKRDLNELLSFLAATKEEYNDTRKKAGKAKKEYDQLREICENEMKAGEGRQKEMEAELTAFAADVDPKMLTRYKQVKRNQAVPIAKVENNQCGGCNMSLPSVVIKRVASSDSIVECDNCGRILYAPETA